MCEKITHSCEVMRENHALVRRRAGKCRIRRGVVRENAASGAESCGQILAWVQIRAGKCRIRAESCGKMRHSCRVMRGKAGSVREKPALDLAGMRESPASVRPACGNHETAMRENPALDIPGLQRVEFTGKCQGTQMRKKSRYCTDVYFLMMFVSLMRPFH